MHEFNELELLKITKAFREKRVYENFSYRFGEGIYALLGVNGCGKSTLISLMAGIEDCDTGEIYINNIDLKKNPQAAKSCLAYIPDKPDIYPFMTGQDFLELIASIKKVTTISENLLELFSLHDMRLKQFHEMSLGTQKKFFIIAGLLGNPGIILLDEPTNGLDPTSITHLINELLKYRKAGAVIIFSSHDLPFTNALEAQKCYLSNQVNYAFTTT